MAAGRACLAAPLFAGFDAGRVCPAARFASDAFLAGVALRTGAFSAAERFFKAGFGRAVLAAGFVLLAVDFVAVL
ncbi:MAG TPA: hypothetical protein VF240_16485 [Pyrinomonadaceae bacterium]